MFFRLFSAGARKFIVSDFTLKGLIGGFRPRWLRIWTRIIHSFNSLIVADLRVKLKTCEQNEKYISRNTWKYFLNHFAKYVRHLFFPWNGACISYRKVIFVEILVTWYLNEWNWSRLLLYKISTRIVEIYLNFNLGIVVIDFVITRYFKSNFSHVSIDSDYLPGLPVGQFLP